METAHETASFLIFMIASALYLVITIYCYLIYDMYWRGYYLVKKSNIIRYLSLLFLSFAFQFASLLLMPILAFFGYENGKFILYVTATISAIFSIRYAYLFAYYSQHEETLPIIRKP